ncbi:GNAT family N-acetyltransferase [Gemmatimonadota bacterium]
MNARAFNTRETLADGETVRIRFLRPVDKDGLVGLFSRLSPRTIYQRFLVPRGNWTKKELEYLTDLDGRRRVALVATLAREGKQTIVGLTSYMMAPGEQSGRPELGIVVEDAHQNRGIGTLLLQHLLEIASAEGIVELEAHILAENNRLVAPLAHLGPEVTRVVEAGMTFVTFRTDAALEHVSGLVSSAKVDPGRLTFWRRFLGWVEGLRRRGARRG